MEISQNEFKVARSLTDQILFRVQVQRELDKIRQEVEDTYVLR